MEQISFGTSGWRATLDVFTDERVRIVAQAAATYFQDVEEKPYAPVAVGYDARETSEGFAESIAEVLAGNGFDVVLTERDTPTPVVSHAVLERELTGAVVVTASHNPPEYNGLKVLPADGAPPLPDVSDAIEANLAPPERVLPAKRGTIERFDPIPAHARHATELVGSYFDTDLDGLTVVYDALHGSGRGVTDALLESAGADVIRRRCTRDPNFGGTSPEPGPENLRSLAEAVEEHDADLGIANDGDADRVVACTPERGYLDGNLLFAAMYEGLLTEGDASGSVVRTVSTTALLDRIAEEYGESVQEVPVGFKWIAKGMCEHDALVGGEESDGFTIRGHVRQKDGVLIALLVAAMDVTESIDDRVDRITDTYGGIYADKTSVDCPDERKAEALDALEEDLPETVAGEPVDRIVTLDGVKLFLEDGTWLLVRPSGTEPKLRVYVESPHEDRVTPVLEAGKALVEGVFE